MTKQEGISLILGLALAYTLLVYAPDREKAGYYRGLCEAGQGLTDAAAEYCAEIHP